MRIILVGFRPDNGTDLKAALHDLGLLSVAVCPGQGLLRDTSALQRLRLDLVMIDLDGFATLDIAVDTLVAFRKACPGTAVVALSREVSGDDTGPERAAICDSTLRLPVSGRRLRDGLAAALDNLAATDRGL